MILNQKLIPIVLVVTMVTWVVAYAIDTSSLTQEEIIQIKRTELEDQNARIELHNKMFEDDCTIKALDKYPDDTKERNKFRYACIDSITTPLVNIELELKKYSSWTVTHASSWVASWIKEDTIPRPKVMDKFWLSGCRLTNTDHELKRLNLSWYGYDYACIQWKTFSVYAPADVSVEKIGYDTNLWQYIVLKHKKDTNIRFVLWHIWSQLKEWQFIREWEKVWDVIEWKNGSSSGTHLHMEIWYGYTNVSYEFALGLKYKSLDGTVLLNDRRFNFWQPQPKETPVYYFTKYDLGDVSQNDASPCYGASWKDLCALEKSWVKTMALTSDVRAYLWIKFWDKVKLTWAPGCEWTYQVEDEMNLRFRSWCIKRPWTDICIKWDLPSKEGWACSVTKL